MDADSSYGGSDTAQDSTLANDHSISTETTIPSHNTSHDTHNSSPKTMESTLITIKSPEEPNTFYHKNEITLPVNYDETDFQVTTPDKSPKLPHYLSTAKLNITETLENHSNLEQMSKSYSSTHKLHTDTPKPKKKSAAGVDNPAYQEDEAKQEANGVRKSTFDGTKSYNNGDLNCSLELSSPAKNDEPMTEAVNLELVNMKPMGKDVAGLYENAANGNGVSGIPVKKETEVDIGNPYDEYFVPVNEHRKYMSETRKGRNSVTFAATVAKAGVDDAGLSVTTPERGVLDYPDWLTALENPRGEKLYVTMDKRNQKKRNKCLCWGVCFAIIAAAVIVGILVATGVIGNKEAQPVQEIRARNFGDSKATDIKSAGGLFGTGINGHNDSTEQPLTPSPPVGTVSSHLPTTDTSIIEVPRALESQLVIDNVQFIPELALKNSSEFQDLSDVIERRLKAALFTNEELQYGASDIVVKVMEFMPGSVVVKFRVAWEFKEGVHDPQDPVNKKSLENKLIDSLARNSGYLYKYHIPTDTVVTEKVIDMCQIENNGCEYSCSFNYVSADFKCGCPTGKHLSDDGKKCSNDTESIPDYKFEEVGVHEHQGEPHPLPEPAAEPSPEPTAEPSPEPAAEPAPEPAAEPSPEHASEPSPEPTAEPASEPAAEYSPEPAAEPLPEPTSGPEPQPTAEHPVVNLPGISSEPAAEPLPEPVAEPERLPTAEPPTTHAVETSFVHALDTSSETTAEPHFKNVGQLSLEPTSEKSSEPVAEPEPEAEWTPESAAEPAPEPVSEPSPEPITKASAEMAVESAAVVPLPEPAAEASSTDEKVTETTPEDSTKLHPSAKIEPLDSNSTKVLSFKTDPTFEESSEYNDKFHADVSSAPKEHTTAEPEIKNSYYKNFHIQQITHSTEQSLPEQATAMKDITSNPEFEEDVTREAKTSSAMFDSISANENTSEFKPKINVASVNKIFESATDSSVKVFPLEVNSEASVLKLHETEYSTEINHVVSVLINNEPTMVQTGTDVNTTKQRNLVFDSEKAHNETHQNLASTDPPEQHNNALENMSPFLPDIENDTYVNILHSGMDHYTDSAPEADYITENPRRLDDDEMNVTNPQDPNPTDVILGVIPLQESTSEKQNDSLAESPESSFMGRESSRINPGTEKSTNTFSNIVEQTEISSSESQADTEQGMMDMPEFTEPQAQNNTYKAKDEDETTLNPDIINNVHSNNYFFNLESNAKNTEEVVKTTTLPPPSSNTDKTETETKNITSLFITENYKTVTLSTQVPNPENVDVAQTNNQGEHINEIVTEQISNDTNNDIENLLENQDITTTTTTEDSNIMHIDGTTIQYNSDESGETTEENETLIATPSKMQNLTSSTTLGENHRENSLRHFTNFDASTEDLIAMETTTNGIKFVENEQATKVVGIKEINMKDLGTREKNLASITNSPNEGILTEISAEPKEILADIVETATAIVSFNDEKEDKMNVESTTATQNDDENAITTDVIHTTKSHQYEVHEVVAEEATTLAVTTYVHLKTTTPQQTTTTAKTTEKEDEAYLSVVPLPKKEEINKLDKKREDDHLNQLNFEYDPNNLNDISSEEQSVLDKFNHHHINDVTINNPDKNLVTDTTLVQTTVETKSSGNEYLLTTTKSRINEYNTIVDGKNKYNTKKYNTKIPTTAEDKIWKEINTSVKPVVEEIDEIQNPDDATTTKHVFVAIKPVTEDLTFTGFSKCATGQFQCANGTSVKDGTYCIPRNDRCDSVDDCTDASDEIGCEQEGCPDNFRCSSGQCLKRHLVCDGIVNCNDGTDEVNCDSWECRFDELSCGAGKRCIPISWKCDGRAQCPEAIDEYNCHPSTCEDHEYHCLEQNTCISASWRCDNQQDCMNFEDEKLCECAVDQFKCATGGGCIQAEHRCDGVEQCADLSDEWNCIRIQDPDFTTLQAKYGNSSYLQILSPNNTWHEVCAKLWTNSHSDLVCQSLGYTGATLTEYSQSSSGLNTEGYYRVKRDQQHSTNLLAQLENTEHCDAVVSLACQEFTCGSHTSLDIQSARIIGGSSAAETQWPSLTLLYNKKRNTQCTASLLSPLWVIASYDCVVGGDTHSTITIPSDWVLYAGGSHFFNNIGNPITKIRAVNRIIPHPQAKYSQFVFKNDVVLVNIDIPLPLGRNVSAICLPDKDIEPRSLCVVAGWGTSTPGASNLLQYLHYLPVPIIDVEECNSTKHYNGLVGRDKICAGYTDSDKTPCYNDEGAPLMCFSESANTWELQGILSYHSNCGRSHHPAIYTSINADIRQWIINTTGRNATVHQRTTLNSK